MMSATLLFENGRVYPMSRPPIDDGALLVEDGKIAFVGSREQLGSAGGRGLRRIDLGKRALLPGLCDSHLHLLETAGGELDLLALDIDAERAARIGANLDRAGYAARVCTGDAARPDEWWDGSCFDRILLDAPCSGLGVVRRHPDIRFLRRADDIPAMAARQRQLLQSLWPLLRPGGQLLYVTCSVLRAENEAVVEAFVTATEDAAVVPPPVALPAAASGVAGGWQLLPGTADTDGFYYALMAKGL